MRFIVFLAVLTVPLFSNAQSIEVNSRRANYSLRYENTFVNFKVGNHLSTWKVKSCGDWTYKNHFAVLKSKIHKEGLRLPAGTKNTVRVLFDR